MNKILALFGVIFALAAFSFQGHVFAENAQGTITEIDLGGHRLVIMPPYDKAEPATYVKVLTAPGVRYVGLNSFEDLQLGDYVKIKSSTKSRSGSAVEATSIERTLTAAANAQAKSLLINTGSREPVTAVTNIPAQTVTTTIIPNEGANASVVSGPNTATSEVATTTTTTTY